ncbi:MAG: succinate dehydrogenase assembly factor 2 [Candidatus Pelagibacter sp.]|nr:succinate dehydrogenase assembly factor 2 [Candidatus Pelagibacter sp.]|tara:strand:+ start:4732 stop:4989 length:258 start_codon:yes stop_codon:yes gene_type:complete
MNNTDFIKKLIFRSSHRGTKEMDLVLGGYFKKNYNTLSDKELVEFEKLLDFSDKILTDYFVMNKTNANVNGFEIVKKIKNYLEGQ